MKILIISPKNKTVYNFRGDMIRDMIAAGHSVYVTGPNRDFLEDIRALGVTEFFELRLKKDKTSLISDAEYYLQLRRLIRRLRPDMVFSYTIKPVIYGSLAARAEKTPKIFAMVEGLGRVYTSESAKAAILRSVINRLYRLAFRACDRVILLNPDDLRELVEAGCLPKEKAVRVNGCGVNMERFSRTPLPEKPVFLMVSRIIREKGVMEYCEAARAVRKCCPEAKCLLLGGFDSSLGALRPEELQPYLEDGSIELLPEQKDPVGTYGSCSAFVLPSYYREGMPRTILEAMSCGRPVITTDSVGCRETVEDGESGFLVPVRDVGRLADRMLLLCRSAELREEMGQKAFRRCGERFDVRLIDRELKGILQY